ncbi:MAG: hypothetical protein ACOCYE_08790 [Pseudomonadota bacterium]
MAEETEELAEKRRKRDEHAARVAAEMRANLKRRKAQARARAEAQKEPSPDDR